MTILLSVASSILSVSLWQMLITVLTVSLSFIVPLPRLYKGYVMDVG